MIRNPRLFLDSRFRGNDKLLKLFSEDFLGGATAQARMVESIEGYVNKKYHHENAAALRKEFCPGRDPRRDWQFVLVFNKLKKEEAQTALLRGHDVEPVKFTEILRSLTSGDGLHFKTDSDAAHLVVLLSSG